MDMPRGEGRDPNHPHPAGCPSDAAGLAHVTAFCPAFHRAIEVIGRRWTGAILRALLSGATRFTDVTAAVPNLSDRLLSERLKELEAEGIVSRTVIPDIPVRIEYRLTDKGRDLEGVIAAVSTWAEEWGGRDLPAACPTAPAVTERALVASGDD